MDVKNVISSSLGGMIGVTVILICVPCPFYTIIMFYMYSRRKEIIVLSYSLMIRKHCGKTQTYTHKEKNKKERESDPIVVFCPALTKDWELSVNTEIGWHWAPSRMTMGHQQYHDQGLRTHPSSQPCPQPAMHLPNRISSRKSALITLLTQLQETHTFCWEEGMPDRKSARHVLITENSPPDYSASRAEGGGGGWKRPLCSTEWGEEGR